MKDETIDKEIEHFFNLEKKSQKENLNEYDIAILEKGLQANLQALKHIDDSLIRNFYIKKVENKGEIYTYNDVENLVTDIYSFVNELSDNKDDLIYKAMKYGNFDNEDKETADKAIKAINNYKDVINILLLKIKIATLSIQRMAKISPSIEGYINAKKPRKKSQNQIDSEEIAKRMWAKDEMLSIEYVAKEIIFNLDLSQSLATVKGWIKPLDPLLGTGIKRKRQSKKK